MKFIEVTDESGDKILVNLDRVEHISAYSWKGETEVHAELYLVNDSHNLSIYIQETYEQIKEMLNVR